MGTPNKGRGGYFRYIKANCDRAIFEGGVYKVQGAVLTAIEPEFKYYMKKTAATVMKVLLRCNKMLTFFLLTL